MDMSVVRSFFDPDWFTVPQGWRLTATMWPSRWTPNKSEGDNLYRHGTRHALVLLPVLLQRIAQRDAWTHDCNCG